MIFNLADNHKLLTHRLEHECIEAEVRQCQHPSPEREDRHSAPQSASPSVKSQRRHNIEQRKTKGVCEQMSAKVPSNKS